MWGLVIEYIFILEKIVAFARPSNDGDYLLSVIEIRESGEILLNNNST